MLRIVLIALCALPAPFGSGAPSPALVPAASVVEVDALKEGRECTRLFYAEDGAALWPRFSEAVRAVFGDASKLPAFRAQLDEQLGAEREVLREDVLPQGELLLYRRKARFEKYEEPILVLWSFDSDGLVQGFQITPETVRPAESEYLEYETKTPLRLPFAPGDEWFVFWGGREVAQNYHAAYVDQRFAYDLLAMRDGATHAGEGKRNEDYYCFDRELFAPGPGVVAQVENGVADNVPGEMNANQALGNFVVIDHENGEYSFLAHFKQGSVAVKAGQRVQAGDYLGRSGNSGNSSEPHLHYHLQDAPEFQQGGRGMPSFFLDYVADGEPVERGEPVRGQVLRVSSAADVQAR